MTRHLAALALALLPLAAEAQEFTTTTWTCERGVEIPVTIVAGAAEVAVLNVEGRQITLVREEAAAGARFGWPSDGSHYVWWEQDGTADLSWVDGALGEEVTLLHGCEPL